MIALIATSSNIGSTISHALLFCTFIGTLSGFS
jgi:hypothetical protein